MHAAQANLFITVITLTGSDLCGLTLTDVLDISNKIHKQ